MVCPSNTTTASVKPTATSGIPQHYFANGGYTGSYHAALNYARPMDSPDGAALASIDSPAQCILVVEYDGAARNQGNVYSTSSAGGMNFQNHLGTTNFLFVDGHVKSLKPTATIAGGVNMWANDPASAVNAGLSSTLGTEQNSMQ